MVLDGALDVTVSADDPSVTFAFLVTNRGAEPIELQFTDACRAEFVVERAGEERWRYTDGRLFAQVLGSQRIDPGETVTYDAEWPDPREGEYAVDAHLDASNATCDASAQFAVRGSGRP